MMKAKILFINTRTQADNAFQAACRQYGYTVLNLPLLDLQPKYSILNTLNTQAQKADALFFVSPSAIKMAADYLDWPHFSGSLLAIGSPSAQILQQISQKPVLYPTKGNDSEALLKLPFWQENCGKLLIVRGENGRNFLAQTLQKMGWQVNFADIYRRVACPFSVPAVLQQIDKHQKTVVLIASRHAAQVWLAQIALSHSDVFKNLLYCTIHQRIADYLREQGVKNIVISAKQADDLLNELHQRRGLNVKKEIQAKSN